jgi:hypothetical protein
MSSSNKLAQTAPGSPPVDPLQPGARQGDPTIKLGAKMPVGTSGKPQASKRKPYKPGAPVWVRAGSPRAPARIAPVNAPGAQVSEPAAEGPPES